MIIDKDTHNIIPIKNIISLEDLLKEIKEEDSLFILEQKDYINEKLLNII